MNTRTALPLLAGLLALPILLVLPKAQADDFVVREYRFDLDGIEELEFHGNVGSFHILPADDNELRLVLEIEGRERGWFRRSTDVSGVELQSRTSGNRLRLEQQEDDTSTVWTIRLPAVARTSISLGVGAIDGEFGATSLDIELGVGEVDVALPAAAIGPVELSVGVGDARLHGMAASHSERSLVSQEVRASGAGTAAVQVELGVGDIDVEAL